MCGAGRLRDAGVAATLTALYPTGHMKRSSWKRRWMKLTRPSASTATRRAQVNLHEREPHITSMYELYSRSSGCYALAVNPIWSRIMGRTCQVASQLHRQL